MFATMRTPTSGRNVRAEDGGRHDARLRAADAHLEPQHVPAGLSGFFMAQRMRMAARDCQREQDHREHNPPVLMKGHYFYHAELRGHLSTIFKFRSWHIEFIWRVIAE